MSREHIAKLEEMLDKIQLQIEGLRETDRERLVKLIKDKLKINEEINKLRKQMYESRQREQQDWDDR